MKLKVVFVTLLILLLIGAAVADAKSSGRGGRSSGSGSKSFSSNPSQFLSKDTAAKAVAVSTLPAFARNKKKIHDGDDLFENETENDTTQQSPSTGVLPAYFAIGILLMAWRHRNG
jgi:preprotein translocase subunit SecG